MNLDRIKEFVRFVEKELMPGVSELEKLNDANRKHVQKLVYTNLVDRFDYMIDKLILDNCREEQLVSLAFEADDQPVTEKELISLLLSGSGLENALTSKLQDKLRLSSLRRRHSQKLETLLSLFDEIGDFRNKPRVNPSSGAIVDNFKKQKDVKLPHSISGYADWLYSRRNALVHGAGSSNYLENDRKQIKKRYKIELPKTFKISTASIRNASSFYTALCAMVQDGA
jgi:hypothetical protein